MRWVLLTLAGLLEIVWAVGLKYTEGFSRPLPSVMVVAAIAASMLLLAMAMRTLPVSTAYAIWTGIGIAGTAIVGMMLLGESVNTQKLISLALIMTGILGLRLAT